jgi:hypothetical protein
MMIYASMRYYSYALVFLVTTVALGCGAPLAPSVPKLQNHTLAPNVQIPALVRGPFNEAIGVRISWSLGVEVCRGVSELITRSCETQILGEEKAELVFEKNSDTLRKANLKKSLRLTLEEFNGARDYEFEVTALNTGVDLAITVDLTQILDGDGRFHAEKTLQKSSLPFPNLKVSGKKTKLGWDHRQFIWEEPELQVTKIELF